MAYSSKPLRGPYGIEYVEELERVFYPQSSPMHRLVPADQLVVYTAAKKVRQLREKSPYRGDMSVDGRSVVVSIDGAYRGNGTRLARAAWGVYFGPQSPYNASGLVDPALSQTSTRAEIQALSQALHIIRNISRDFSLREYYIITDSSYLVQACAEWIQDWIENDGRSSRGKKVAHFEVLKDINERLDDMTYGDEGGMHFKFWLVPRDFNREADALANEALDQ
ncbi:ribonuclease H-like domain-containing protein [Trichoderma ceciliae]